MLISISILLSLGSSERLQSYRGSVIDRIMPSNQKGNSDHVSAVPRSGIGILP